MLVPEEGVYEFVFPTVVGPRYSSQKAEGAPERDRFVASPYQKEGEEPKTELDIRVALSPGVPLRDLTSPSHKVHKEQSGVAKAVVRLDPEEDHGGNRDFILRYRLAGAAIASGLLLHQGDEENTFLLMAQPPARVAPSDVPPREYLFAVDVVTRTRGRAGHSKGGRASLTSSAWFRPTRIACPPGISRLLLSAEISRVSSFDGPFAQRGTSSSLTPRPDRIASRASCT
jgi:hypothetical protein